MSQAVATKKTTFQPHGFCYAGANTRIDPAIPACDSSNTLVTVFGPTSVIDAEGDLRRLLEQFPRSTVVGCSTAGQIHNDRLHDDSWTVGVARFDDTRLACVGAEVRSAADSYSTGKSLGRDLAKPDLRAVFVLSDGIRVNGTKLIEGINGALPEGVVVTGGLAGDGTRFQRTWVLSARRPVEGFVSAVGFYGSKVRVGHGSRGGWDPFGPERVVTRSEGNVLFELDGRAALDLYKEYLGDRAAELPSSALLFPLSIRSGRDSTDHRVRTILSVSEKDQSMTFAGDIPTGSFAQLMRANFDRLIDAAGTSAGEAVRMLPKDRPCLSVAISCVGRRLILGERTEEELEQSLAALPKGSSQVGFYSYGELSPGGVIGCDLHNQTLTTTMISEAP